MKQRNGKEVKKKWKRKINIKKDKKRKKKKKDGKKIEKKIEKKIWKKIFNDSEVFCSVKLEAFQTFWNQCEVPGDIFLKYIFVSKWEKSYF